MTAASTPSPGLREPSERAQGATSRDRLLDGLAQVVDEVGYPAARIRDISAAARASLSTFYQQFSSKEQCLIALAERLEGPVAAWCAERAGHAAPAGEATLRPLLEEALELAAARPRLASALLLELGASGTPEALRARRRSRAVLAQALQEAAAACGAGRPSRACCQFAIGGLVEGLALAIPKAGDALGPPDHQGPPDPASLAELAAVAADVLAPAPGPARTTEG